jgi:hypothetical protein
MAIIQKELKKKKRNSLKTKRERKKTHLRLLPAKLSMKGERREQMKTLR